MIRTCLAALVGLALAAVPSRAADLGRVATLLPAHTARQTKKDADKKKDAAKEKSAKKAAPKKETEEQAAKREALKERGLKGTPATVVKVDVEKGAAVVQTEAGKKIELKIGEDVVFVGPRGGISDAGIKDGRFVAGSEVRLVMDAGGRTLKEVHLPYRKSEDKEAEKEKPKDKPKKDAEKKKSEKK
jgi:hypothetical protein